MATELFYDSRYLYGTESLVPHIRVQALSSQKYRQGPHCGCGCEWGADVAAVSAQTVRYK